MLASRTQIGIIAGGLMIFGLGLTLYKSISLGLPLVPEKYQDVWTIESKISFYPTEGPAEVSLSLPAKNNGWVTLNENFASSGFGFTVATTEQARDAQWTKQNVSDFTTVYYKAQVYNQDGGRTPQNLSTDLTDLPRLSETQSKAFELFVGQLREKSNNESTFVSLMLKEFASNTNQDVEFILSDLHESKVDAIRYLLTYAGIPSHFVRGIQLEDGRRRQVLSTLLEAYVDGKWLVLNPTDGTAGMPEDFYLWKRGEDAVLTVFGGEKSSLEFALVKNSVPIRTVVSMEQRSEEFALLDFSIYALPVEQQGIFKGLLLIPVAALVVVFMRIVVGLSTSGTFMPILIALALIQTTLLVGLAIFLAVVGVGLWIRSYLSHMNLLLVSRVASVVIVVILLMAAIAIVSYKLGIDQALTVTFFPTIILAWTIERMSILWEEEGGHEVFIQGGGSLMVAVLAYLVMSNRYIEHLTFNFPELLLTLLGVILLMGKYTGYRLSELYRFREMKKLL
ncbi:inactive transglutaminase family protein [Congregibacter variabilis]|uniref:Inactive transglutaminase family protein n=1 Tax=Congregibacter variabilis TaxID=3081200 RepID=A0ABZ0I3L8_9GAMM|nr:inactive transglutaminase family protein [Congregibacter sp. IMCC43200]